MFGEQLLNVGEFIEVGGGATEGGVPRLLGGLLGEVADLGGLGLDEVLGLVQSISGEPFGKDFCEL